MSPAYSASLLERLSAGSLWAEVASTSLSCRKLDSASCNVSECGLSGDTCGISAPWVARQLSSPNVSSVAKKCGLLGRIMADEATCSELGQSTCGPYNGTVCSWDRVRGVCGIPPADVLRSLRQDGGQSRRVTRVRYPRML